MALSPEGIYSQRREGTLIRGGRRAEDDSKTGEVHSDHRIAKTLIRGSTARMSKGTQVIIHVKMTVLS